MKVSIYVLTAILGLSVMLLTTGCVKRPVYIEDNTVQKVTLIDQQKVGALFGTVYSHIYYVCKDMGDTLDCTAACGGESEYKCPSMFNGQPPWTRFATNQRTPYQVGSSGAAASEMEGPATDDTGEEVAE